jgi:hypothetical protein
MPDASVRPASFGDRCGCRWCHNRCEQYLSVSSMDRRDGSLREGEGAGGSACRALPSLYTAAPPVSR